MVDIAATPLTRLFWEYDQDQRARLPDEVIFARVMERGTLDDSRWLLDAVPRATLAAWFDARAGSHLTPRACALWACLLQRPVPPAGPSVPWRYDN